MRWKAVCGLARQLPEVADDPTGSMMVVRLATVDINELWPVLVDSWRRSAPATLVTRSDPGSTPRSNAR